MDDQALNQLLAKYSANQLTEQEHQQFVNWLNTAPEDEVKEALAKAGRHFQNSHENDPADYNAVFNRIESELDSIEEDKNSSNYHTMWARKLRTISAAAVLLIAAGLAVYFNMNSPELRQAPKVVVKRKPIVPGTNKAVLTLANGQAIELNSAANGRLAVQNNYSIVKLKEGQLAYKPLASNEKKVMQEGFNTITTPRGGQYQITLPDGTRVWLNAASSLKYQATFAGKQRRVMLNGEAYFEVAKNKLKPFIVSFNNTEVRVLGTHFNVMSYNDEAQTHTTLLEGSVNITKGKNSQTIVPGQQAAVGENIKVAYVDTTQVVGWKNGNFTFAHEKINTVMNKIARWYDIDIDYQGNITQEDFVGTIPRSKNLGEVLHKLELTGLLHFKVKERRVIVMR
ncbi:FecR family protein [Mucilaginibacter galii]|nr:FecR family protein [Mucilaginibacter galii]